MFKTNSLQKHNNWVVVSGISGIIMAAIVALLMGIYTQNTAAISQSTRPTLVGQEIHMGPDGGHVIMKGVNIWGIETITMDGFGDDQYADRVNIINTIKSWGANHLRFRLQASDYNAETFMTKAEYLDRIVEWRDLATTAGIYFMPVWWDGHDGPYSGANWPADHDQAFPMMTDVVNALGDDPMVFYEPFNEPTGAVNDVDWVSGMKDTINHFRTTLGYTGILVIDPRVWSHCYDNSDFTDLEQYDAAQPGMNGTHQLIFSKHDYANEYSDPDAGFDDTEWATNAGGCETWDMNAHAVWESEFGNYNIDPSSVHLPWSQGAAAWMSDKVEDGTLSGATAFLFGPWLDENAMTAADNVTKTTWGTYVDDIFLTAPATLNGIGTLGSLVFADDNKDGVYNPADGDNGLSNVTVAVYENLTAGCSAPGAVTPLLTATTDIDGGYEFTMLSTDDGEITNGAGAKYTVVVTDTNDVLDQYEATAGAADTNNNAQTPTAYCVTLTGVSSDIQYADFGFGLTAAPGPGPTDPGDDDNAGSGGEAGFEGDGELAETGQSAVMLAVIAAIAMTVGGVVLAALYRRKKLV